MIEPKVDEYSEVIKYKLFDLHITEADIHITEDAAITRLQVSHYALQLITNLLY